MKEMLENHRNKRMQRKFPKAQTSANSEKEKFEKNLLWRDRLTFFEKVCKVYKERTYFNANYDTSVFNDGSNNESRYGS